MGFNKDLLGVFKSNFTKTDYERVVDGLASAYGYEQLYPVDPETQKVAEDAPSKDDFAAAKLGEWIQNVVRGEEAKKALAAASASTGDLKLEA